jgi:hypothetical protein
MEIEIWYAPAAVDENGNKLLLTDDMLKTTLEAETALNRTIPVEGDKWRGVVKVSVEWPEESVKASIEVKGG